LWGGGNPKEKKKKFKCNNQHKGTKLTAKRGGSQESGRKITRQLFVWRKHDSTGRKGKTANQCPKKKGTKGEVRSATFVSLNDQTWNRLEKIDHRNQKRARKKKTEGGGKTGAERGRD